MRNDQDSSSSSKHDDNNNNISLAICRSGNNLSFNSPQKQLPHRFDYPFRYDFQVAGWNDQLHFGRPIHRMKIDNIQGI